MIRRLTIVLVSSLGMVWATISPLAAQTMLPSDEALDSEPVGLSGRQFGGRLSGREAGPGELEAMPLWTISADAVFLQRMSPLPKALMYNTADESQSLDASAFKFNFQPGVDLAVARRLGCESALEIRYFGISEWHAGASAATTPGDLLEMTGPHPIYRFAGSAIDAAATSELQNVELNYLHQFCQGLTGLVGFRYAQLDEHFHLSLRDLDLPFVYDSSTKNRLYGAQIGGNVAFWDCGGPLTLGASGKAGIYGNQAANENSQYPQDPYTLPATGKTTGAAFIGELGVNANYHFTESLALRAGYRLLWIDGVALATNQVGVSNFIDDSGIHAAGDAFYHGAFVGLEFQR